jgi:histidinol-phosphate aminotransferase
MTPAQLVRPLVRALHPYVPGEQPKIRGLVKLNTNENPYPPSAKVLRAVKSAVDERLRLYPNPTSSLLREKLAKLHRCKREHIIIGNGSDELLAMAVRAFVEPSHGGRRESESTVQYFTPSYSLYPVLAAIHGACTNPVQLSDDFTLPALKSLKNSRAWDFDAALTFITTPNAPSGRGYRTVDLEKLCRSQRGVVVLDEAYVDFAKENALELALKFPNVIIARTFSKAYSLCFQRVGYFVAHPALIEALDKIRDSYNVNGLGQVAALATLDDLPYYRENFQRVTATRERLSSHLRGLGFDVFPSSTNFLLVRPPIFSAKEWLEKLRSKKILVRWFSAAEGRGYLRISIGTDADARFLIAAARRILAGEAHSLPATPSAPAARPRRRRTKTQSRPQ